MLGGGADADGVVRVDARAARPDVHHGLGRGGDDPDVEAGPLERADQIALLVVVAHPGGGHGVAADRLHGVGRGGQVLGAGRRREGGTCAGVQPCRSWASQA